MTALPPAHRFSTSTCTGEVYDHGAHVTAWQPTGAEPVLWLSASTDLESNKPIRGGVPICWPWFGAGRSGDQKPAHGLARLVTWRVVSTDEGADTATVVFELAPGDDPRLPAGFVARYSVTFGASLVLALEVTNTGEAEFSYEEALHTYLTVSDARRVQISGLAGSTYFDKAAGGVAGNVQSGDVTFTAETDRIYDSTADVVLTDPGLGRTVTVRKEGSADTVVWNPWIDKAQAMPDFGDDEWQTMCCIEAVNCGDHAVVLTPGESHRLVYELTVS